MTIESLLVPPRHVVEARGKKYTEGPITSSESVGSQSTFVWVCCSKPFYDLLLFGQRVGVAECPIRIQEHVFLNSLSHYFGDVHGNFFLHLL
uniref:Uncharacterized protein n=1 Tax=Cannabis sativa TaxID=3483 RepID=A0A803NLA0_CANSA